ncbi:MAG: trimethylamine methyltransferase family protein, partial [Candidatus Bathyarchaeia archaeon]
KIADKYPLIAMEWIIATEMKITEKTLMGPSFFGCAKWIVKMAKALGQDMLGSITMASPLTYPKEQVEGLISYAQANNPLAILSGPSLGATGPATLAGALLLENAEVLAGLVLAQLIKPNIGILLQAYATPLDMRYGTMSSGAVEVGIMAVGIAQVWRSYGVPTGVFFPMTDSKLPDEQAAYEKYLQLLLCALAGINYIMPCGGLENEESQSIAQIVIDNEVCGMVGRILDGIKVNEETLAIDLIKEVGPIPGNYLKKQHTRDWWKKERYLSKLSTREPYEKWLSSGAKDVVKRALEIGKEIIKAHKPPGLSKELNEKLDEILKMAEKEKGVS